MTFDLRWIWARLNANYWFYPALFAVAATALAFGMIWLDRNGFAEWLNDVAWIVPARPDGASQMLTVIAGSMIGVASTVFSITIAAVAYASGNYGPRLLTNFMEDRGNQLSLATFIGTFVYSLVVLRAVRGENETMSQAAADAAEGAATTLPGFVPQLSLLIAFLLMGFSVAVLVFFLNHIPASIRINTVLEGIGSRLLRNIREDYPHDFAGPGDEKVTPAEKVLATAAGYVRLIDFMDLKKVAKDADCRILLDVRTGDFIHAGMVLARLSEGASAENLADKVRECFSVGASRTAEQDPEFLIDELVEIALRALSPGINDPFTAITALHWLGAATAELGQRDLRRHDAGEKPGERTIIPPHDDFAHFVRRGFGAVRGAVATSRLAAKVMLDTVCNAACGLDDESRVALLRQEGDRLMEQARTHLRGPDLEEVEARYAGFENSFS